MKKIQTQSIAGSLMMMALITPFAGLAVPDPEKGSALPEDNQPVSSNIMVTGTTFADVTSGIVGKGFINVVNNGAHVAVSLRGSGLINIVNNGGYISATNTGNGVMTINSTATGTLTVFNTGNGRISVYAIGTAPISIRHSGDEDFTYPG
jgi:hypothetical protein